MPVGDWRVPANRARGSGTALAADSKRDLVSPATRHAKTAAKNYLFICLGSRANQWFRTTMLDNRVKSI
jgi:hypothetical protein